MSADRRDRSGRGATFAIRPERPNDVAAIRALLRAAFADAPHSDGTEAAIVDALRGDGDLALSLVAEAGEVVAHVAFSPVAVGGEREGWFGLGPVCVRSDRRRRGIAAALIGEGLDRLRARGVRGCVLIGDPAFYARFGFRAGSLSWRDVPPKFVQGLAFGGPAPAGEIAYAPAFG